MASSATNPDTLVTLKVNVEGSNRRFKLPLRDLGASTLPDKLRFLLAISPSTEAIFERYSDSAASFVVLDPANASVYKQLYRAAKAKLKLRLKVTIIDHPAPSPPAPSPKQATVEDEEPSPVSPVEEKPVMPSYVTPAPAVEQSIRAGSVAEIQNRFEDLLINQPRFSPKAPAPIVSSSCCTSSHPMFPVHSPKMPSPSRNEIPVTRGAAARDRWFAELAGVSQDRQNAIRNHTGCPAPSSSVFSVYCNNCSDAIPDEHYHCSTCDDGDFDLCQECVDNGVLCGGDGHWMIKRFVKSGKVINSTTETIAPKPKVPSFSESKSTLVPEEAKIIPTRTCNSCIQELTVENFVTCTSCDDYDLCISCHVAMEHGHHPKHAFSPAVEDANLDVVAQALLAPGRNTGHNAICDGCDKYIYGVRHKCLDCPDWDFCSTCVPNASFIHPRHRFVPIYEPLNDHVAFSQSYSSKAKHHGIYCDGPLCNSNNGVQSYIKGDRYKCAVCHDTDFCASCEASPSNGHNRTHPLIKFKTPVRNVSVTTLGDHEDGKPMPVMGDRRARQSKATETTPAQSTNAATQVQTVADLQPTEPVKAEESHEVEAEETPEVKTEEVKELPARIAEEDLVAHFVKDVIADGSVLQPNTVFEQTWYLRNGGNTSWPAGCSVKFVGGDNMCAVDPGHPASVHELVSAAESTTCYTEVAPGQEAGFTVLMRTPNRKGNFISYWRLTGPDGGKFGHRLWCDVNVTEPIVKEEVAEPKAEAEGSQMIFPKLEKESPATSIHEESVVAATETEVEEDDFEDFVEETLDDDETEDGFMTDEEYDILDASDEEYLAEQEKAARK
ncbi:NBR1-like protein [Lachnellula suecica]|uniref:NBR1-like protein n=1 Tax=Lachnellula suecica TaxID=602035 RepID=A0A8T9BUW9_9HELO|nr:NBR1-like protein [Lachnellula suecica]